MAASYSPDEVEKIEVSLFLEGVYCLYGYDFREYAPASMRRRILRTMDKLRLSSVSELQDRVLHDQRAMEQFLAEASVNVTSMFRDPPFYAAFRNKVLPALSMMPYVRIWHVGCSTGEEVYSMAILLKEANLLERAKIYATDINEVVLHKAQKGIYPLSQMREFTDHYIHSGGKSDFSAYYTTDSQNAVFRESLRQHIIWAQHNLVTDSSFNEFDVILCRNVLIYFNKNLQNRVHELLTLSLKTGGVLALGMAESLQFTACQKEYEELDGKTKIYRKVC